MASASHAVRLGHDPPLAQKFAHMRNCLETHMCVPIGIRWCTKSTEVSPQALPESH